MALVFTPSPTQRDPMRYKHEGNATGSQKHSRQRHEHQIRKKEVEAANRKETEESGASTGKQKESKGSGRRWRNLDFTQPVKKEWMWRGQWCQWCQRCPSLAHGIVPLCCSTGPNTPHHSASSAHCLLATCHLPSPPPRHQPRQSIQGCWGHLLGRSTDTSGFSPLALVWNNAQLVPTGTGLTPAPRGCPPAPPRPRPARRRARAPPAGDGRSAPPAAPRRPRSAPWAGLRGPPLPSQAFRRHGLRRRSRRARGKRATLGWRPGWPVVWKNKNLSTKLTPSIYCNRRVVLKTKHWVYNVSSIGGLLDTGK